MDEAWLDGTAGRLERLEQSWNDLVQDQAASGAKLRPIFMLLFILPDHVCQLLSIQLRPGLFSYIGDLCQLAMARRRMEAEFARWRLGGLVQLCKTRGEFDRIWGLLADFTELG